MPDSVVITRPAAQAGPLAQRVTALGRRACLLPLLEIEALPDQSGLKATLADIASYDLVAFVSPNAIDAAFVHIDQWPAGVTLAVLGDGSRLALAAHGIDAGNTTIVSPLDAAHSDSEHLLLSLDLPRLRGRKVLIVRGESGRELMAEGLRAAGAIVTVVAAYRRRVPPLTPALQATLLDLLRHDNDWIITSSEALRGLLGLLREIDAADGHEQGQGSTVAKMQQQHLIVPHARIFDTARQLGFPRLTLTGSGDERVLAALQSRP